MGATLRQTIIAALGGGFLRDAVTLFAPGGASGGPPLASSPLATTTAPTNAIGGQEVYNALCRRRFQMNFTDGGTAATGVAEEPIFSCVALFGGGVGLSSSLSQGLTVKAIYVQSLVAVASGIANGANGWTLTVQKRSPLIVSQASSQIALATTQTGDLVYSTGSLAFQPESYPISGVIPGGASAATTIAAASSGQVVLAATSSTITVPAGGTAGFPSNGAISVATATAGVSQTFSYTGITNTTFTGVFGPATTLAATGGAITPVGTATATLNGAVASLPAATITVTSTSGFQQASATQPGFFSVLNSAGVLQTIQYTGLTSTTFTGCTGGSGALATGAVCSGPPIALLGPLDVLTFTLTKVSSGLAVGSATGQASIVIEYEES